MATARIEFVERPAGGVAAVLSGRWTLAAISSDIVELRAALARGDGRGAWDLRQVEALDSAGAMLLWRAWGRALPADLAATPLQLHVFERIGEADAHEKSAVAERRPFQWLRKTGEAGLLVAAHVADFVVLIGQLLLDLAHLTRHPGDWPWREISANIFKGGVRAMPVAALVGFLIGVVLSYLSALQLRRLGAETLIVDVLGMGIIRELGPVLIAVLVAGRSGSAMTAQLGVMRVTEEIDALAAMGVPRSLRLIFPKVAALALAMPLLVLWITVMALLGGVVAADLQLDVGFDLFLDRLPKVVPVANLWIGLAKGFAFGILVALVACHFGLRVKPNTESLSAHTTASVVTAITVVILVDAVFAIVTRGIGVPI